LSGAGASRHFLRVVEVFPPLFPARGYGAGSIDFGRAQREFVEGVKGIAGLADYVLVADLRDPSLLKVSSVQSAALLKAQLGVRAVPVIAARDANRSSVASAVLTSFSLGLDSVFLVWGDSYTAPSEPKNVYDFESLNDPIRLSRVLATRAGVAATIFAPIDITPGSAEGLQRGRSRLSAGANLLLAQPPTTDSSASFRSHSRALRESGVQRRVLLNVFPFRDSRDVRLCAEKFGWTLPPRLLGLADRGEAALVEEEREIVRLAKREGLGGVYVSTRGKPGRAAAILG